MHILNISTKIYFNFPPFKVKKILSVVTMWQERFTMRCKLAELPDYRLKDMGISPEEAQQESQKPFWEE